MLTLPRKRDYTAMNINGMENQEEINTENQEEGLAKRVTHRIHRREKDPDRFFVLRNWLNSIFILGAIAGMCIYFFGNRDTGTYIVLGAVMK